MGRTGFYTKDMYRNSACKQCGVKPAPLICSKCKTRCYCSASCQKLNWPTHKLICALHSRYESVLQRDAMSDPIGCEFRQNAFDWSKHKDVPIPIAFAIASAFKLVNYYDPGPPLADTHIMVLFCVYDPSTEDLTRQIRIVDGKMISRVDFFESDDGIDGRGFLVDDPFREELRQLLSKEGLQELCGNVLPELKGRRFVRCPCVLVGLDGVRNEAGKRLKNVFEPFFTHVVPTYNILPDADMPFIDYEVTWLEGLVSNLRQEPVHSEEELVFRASVRMALYNKQRVKERKSIVYLRPLERTRTKLIDNVITRTISPPSPPLLALLSQPLVRRFKHCTRQHLPLDPDLDPSSISLRNQLIREHLTRDYVDYLKIAVAQYVNREVLRAELNETRIVECLLGGMTLEELSTNESFADSTARTLVELLLKRCGQEQEDTIATYSLSQSGVFRFDNSFDHTVHSLNNGDKLLKEEEQDPNSFYKDIFSVPCDELSHGLIRLVMAMLPIRSAMVFSAIQCPHDLFSLEAVQSLAKRSRRPPHAIPPAHPQVAIRRIERLIKLKELPAEDYDDPEVWHSQVSQAIHLFSQSLQTAVGHFIETTPTFAAAHRHFVATLEYPAQFTSFEGNNDPTLVKEFHSEFSAYLVQGGQLKVDDAVVKQRVAEVEKKIIEARGGVSNQEKKSSSGQVLRVDDEVVKLRKAEAEKKRVEAGGLTDQERRSVKNRKKKEQAARSKAAKKSAREEGEGVRVEEVDED